MAATEQESGLRVLASYGSRNNQKGRAIKPKLRAKDLADEWGVSVPTINRWALHGDANGNILPSTKLGGNRLFNRDQAERFYDVSTGRKQKA